MFCQPFPTPARVAARGARGERTVRSPPPAPIRRPFTARRKRTLPCQFAPRAAFLTAPSARGPLRRACPFPVSLPCSLSSLAPSLPRRALPLAPPPSSCAPSPRLPVSVPPVSFPLVPAPPRLPVFRFLATFSLAHARPSRRVSLLFVSLPLTFSLPPKTKIPLPPRRQEGITAKHTGRGAKTKTPCRPGGRGISEKFLGRGRAAPDATPAYRMRTRITPFVPARARAVSSLGQEAMSMSV